jgi:hypothetical protein
MQDKSTVDCFSVLCGVSLNFAAGHRSTSMLTQYTVQQYKTGNVRMNVTSRRVRVTIFVVEKQ